MRNCLAAASIGLLIACNASEGSANQGNADQAASRQAAAFEVEELTQFDEPWAMTFLPGTRQALVTEKPGRILLWQEGREPVAVAGAPKVDYGGQGGLGDVVAHPNFASNRLVYLSWVEAGEGNLRGAVVGRGRLVLEGGPRIEGLEIVYRQAPKRDGRGHYGHRIAFGPDGKMFVSNGDRQEFDPAQDMSGTLGKIVRLNDDGSVPADNPWASRGGATAMIWTLGHRNPLGLAFDASGRLWEHEMGPQGGDEFNLIERGTNYGYPVVSNGDHYDGKPIPDHDTRPEFNAPEVTFNGLSPAGLIIYSGNLFPEYKGNAFLGGLSGQALVRIAIDGNKAREAERWEMGARIREVEQGPEGAIYLLQDEREGSGGKLLRLVPTGERG